MPVALIDAFSRLAHELAPWAIVVTLLINLWNSWRGKEYSKQNGLKLEEVHQTVNGRMDKIVEVTKSLAKAEGYKQAQVEAEEVQRIGKE